jgi:hypothetical protein
MGSHTETPGKAYYVVAWLINLAQFYLHDPTAARIILPFADKRAVYDMYLHETEDKATLEEYAPCGVPSRSWFYNAWTNNPAANHIKTRKTLRFSLCPQCVEFIETRTHVLDDKERQKVKVAEGIHHAFVRRERGSYYCRRHQATANPEECFSIIIDGADQSAFGSPHHFVHSKGTITHTLTPAQSQHFTSAIFRRRRALENSNAHHGGYRAWPCVPRLHFFAQHQAWVEYHHRDAAPRA